MSEKTEEELAAQTAGFMRAPRTCNCCEHRNKSANWPPCDHCWRGQEHTAWAWAWAGWAEGNWWDFTFPKTRKYL